MAIISCPKCGQSVSSEATSCPNCKGDLKNTQSQVLYQSPYAINTPEIHSSYSTNNIPSVGEWMAYLFVAFIPLIGLIILLVWAFDNYNQVRKNWAIAILLWYIILFFLFASFWGAFFSSFFRLKQ